EGLRVRRPPPRALAPEVPGPGGLFLADSDLPGAGPRPVRANRVGSRRSPTRPHPYSFPFVPLRETQPVLPALVFALIAGLAIGSFLNVVIYRLPRGESIVKPRSRCPHCGHQLSELDNVPV